MNWTNKFSFFLVCFLLVFTTMAYGGVHQPILALLYVLITLMVVLWAVDGYQSGVARVDPTLFQWILLAAAAYGFIQVIPFGYSTDAAGISPVANTISLDPYSTLLNSIYALALLLFFASLLPLLDSIKRITALLNLITIFGFIFAFFGILQSVLSPGKIYGIYEVRNAAPFGSFVNRHNFAAFIEMAIALPLAFLLTGVIKRDKRLLYITMTSLMGVSLILSGSRGGLVALLAEIAVIVLITLRRRSNTDRAIRAGLAVALVLVIIGGSIFVGGESSLSRFVETAHSEDVTTSRSHIWSVTLNVIRDNFPFGAGIGAFGVAYTPFDNHSGLERVEQAHNDYLQLASDMGVVGIALGGLFLFAFFRTGLRNIGTENPYRRGVAVGAFCGCFAVLVHSLFDFVLHTPAIALLFISLLALLIASGRSYADDFATPKGHQKRKRWEQDPLPMIPVD
jgi:O-antigen ligase